MVLAVSAAGRGGGGSGGNVIKNRGPRPNATTKLLPVSIILGENGENHDL